MTFETPHRDSPFLRFTAAEFHRRGSTLRKQLSRKSEVHQRLADLTLGGEQIGLPRQYAVLRSVEEITAEVLGDRVALKFANGWSAKGVMLLERTGDDTYFDHMALREWSLEGIREHQKAVAAGFGRKSPEWIVEEFLEGAQPGAVPFDYKFYMFQGQIGMVAQIDRNSSPPRMVKLDGNLNPLIAGRDYQFRPKDLQSGVPVVPRSAVMLSRWAIELAQMTDAPFVRVDLYDTVKGPYFGEFTFSSGAEYRGTVKYSADLLSRFDAMFAQSSAHLKATAADGESAVEVAGEVVAGEDEGTDHLRWTRYLHSQDPSHLTQQPMIGLHQYQRYAAFLYNYGQLGGQRLAQAQKALAEQGADPEITDMLSQAHYAAGRRVAPAATQRATTATRRKSIPYWAARKVYRTVKKSLESRGSEPSVDTGSGVTGTAS